MLFDDFDDDEMLPDDDISSSKEDETHFKEPRHASNIIGQEFVEQQLFDLLTSKRPPQGLVFTGATGIGKATMAFRVARFLLQQREDTMGLFGDVVATPKNLYVPSTDPIFSLVASGGHLDLMTIERAYDEKTERQKQNLGIDLIRKIPNFLRKTPSVDGGWRIVIVDESETMSNEAQNALLKILEEPPTKSLLILITNNISSLLPTILSRVNIINFPPLNYSDIREALLRVSPHLQEKTVNQILNLSEGSLGRALLYAQPEHISLIEQVDGFLNTAPRFEWSKIQLLAGALGTKDSSDLLKTFHDYLTGIIRQRLKEIMLNGENPIAYFEALERLESEYLKAKFGNLDKKLVVIGAFDTLAKLNQEILPKSA
jgi:DNA polymerase-3 subunit delta'